MTDTTFGPEIAVNGKRPDWLSKGMTFVADHAAAPGHFHEVFDEHFALLRAIRLPADSPIYKALDAGFEPWPGGDAAPADWDGGEVLRDDGDTTPVFGPDAWDGEPGGIIGYRKRTPAAATPADTVQIALMTEAEPLEACGYKNASAHSAGADADQVIAELIETIEDIMWGAPLMKWSEQAETLVRRVKGRVQ